jgi:hypothetical protein
MNLSPVPEPPQSLAVVRDRVRQILDASAEFRALPVEQQDVLLQRMVRAADAAARALAIRRSCDRPGGEESISAGDEPVPAGAEQDSSSKLLESVDFPNFVSALIEGTFKAIVDASIRQTEAYTELLRSVAKSTDEFMHDHVRDDRPCDGRAGTPGTSEGSRRRLAAERQQVLATMVLMGINRIVVTDGAISVGVVYEIDVC